MNPIITNAQKKEDGFEYIKDADMIRCPAGELAIRKRYKKEFYDKNGYLNNAKMEYYFDVNKCKECPYREGCYKEGSKQKCYTVTILSESHKKQQKFENTEYFNETLRKERYKIEAKNAETKIAHGLCKCKYVGLVNMRFQSYIMHIVANVKRIIRIMDKVPA